MECVTLENKNSATIVAEPLWLDLFVCLFVSENGILTWHVPTLFSYVCCLLQVLISGSLESLDIDDLRSNTNYSAGYHPVCVAFLCNKAHLFITLCSLAILMECD
jgi:hypothetical protein